MPRHGLIPEWVDRSACKDADPRIFNGSTPKDTGQAKALCNECPVLFQCRQYGSGERWGIWGGTTPEERGYGKTRKTREAA